MFDFIPIQLWLIAFLGVFAMPPARYVWRHLSHDARSRDVGRPPEDQSWRSDRHLYLSVALLVALVAAGIFILTPFAERFAQSAAFWPAILGTLGSVTIGSVVKDWRDGRVEPLIRGVSTAYARDAQPRRYWASLGWNAVLGVGLLVASLTMPDAEAGSGCDYSDDEATWASALQACDAELADPDIDAAERATLRASRGSIHYMMGDYPRALADQSAALKIDPANPVTLYNRALVHGRMGAYALAIKDLDASIALRPDDDAYHDRGLAHLDLNQFDAAIRDFTTVIARDPDHRFARVNRGIAHAMLKNAALAARDFAAVRPGDPGWPVALRGRAILAMQRRDHRQAIEHLSAALAIDPADRFSLAVRGDAYRLIGERDKAIADHDRLKALAEQARQRRD